MSTDDQFHKMLEKTAKQSIIGTFTMLEKTINLETLKTELSHLKQKTQEKLKNASAKRRSIVAITIETNS